jgi:hypothetical protein
MPITVKDRPQIDYAPKPSGRRSRRIRFLLYALLVIAIVVPVGLKCGPRAWQRVQLLYWQRRAMRYTAPPDLVVYDGTPPSDPMAMWERGYHTRNIGGANDAYIFARPWQEFYALCSRPGRNSAPTLFLHEVRSPMGNRRLVAIEGWCEGSLNGGWLEDHIDLSAIVFRPGSLFSQPTELGSSKNVFELSSVDVSDRIAKRQRIGGRVWGYPFLFAGQLDPSDPAHFTIGYKVHGKPGKIDGWLLDDDTVRLEVRGGTASQ